MANWFEKVWDTLTGQKQETQRTRETNEANERATKAANEANLGIARDTNATNKAIADENLNFQRENLEYQKALQQQIFEREDTSYQRTKADMLAAGLNPLSMQGTNGAGEAIATQPLNNNFQSQQSAPMQATQYQKAQTMSSPLQSILSMVQASTSVAGAVGQISNLGVQRDLLQQQAEKQRLENLVYAKIHDIDENEVKNPFAWDDNTKREYQHKEETGKYDSDSNPEKIATALLDAANGRYDEQVEGAIENVGNKIKEKAEEIPIIKAAVDQYDFNKLNKSINSNLTEARKKYNFGLLAKSHRKLNENGTTTITLKQGKKVLTMVFDKTGKKIDEHIADPLSSHTTGKF